MTQRHSATGEGWEVAWRLTTYSSLALHNHSQLLYLIAFTDQKQIRSRFKEYKLIIDKHRYMYLKRRIYL